MAVPLSKSELDFAIQASSGGEGNFGIAEMFVELLAAFGAVSSTFFT